jgi:predicted TIM-barrel fold metal-dependent hydrolase
VGAENLMIGTDFPYILYSLDWECVKKVEAIKCSESEKQAILEGDVRKLLKFELKCVASCSYE